jgi:ABC-type Fe3+/spermidine/putrescine transport system ATPase subunit
MISLDEIRLRLGDFALDDISLSVEDGEFFILLGPSGVGKTALLEAVAGLNRIHGGRVLLDGHDVTSIPPEARPIGYVPQDASLFPHLNVKDNILFGVRARRMPENSCQSLFDELIQSLQIENLLDRSPAGLSGGERRRVSLARALLTSPRILLLDEPLSGLDPPIRRELQVLVRRLQQQLKGTFLLVTHDREEAFILGDIIAVMIDGKIQQISKRNKVYFHPQNLEVARFTGMENIIACDILDVDEENSCFSVDWFGHRLIVQSDFYRPEAGRRAVLGVRAEEIMLVKPDRPIRERRDFNILDGILEDVLEKGATHTLIIAERTSGELIQMELPNFLYRRYKFDKGRSVSVRIRPDKFCVIHSGFAEANRKDSGG